MAQLHGLACRESISLAMLWTWSSKRLQAELGWSSSLLNSVDAYRVSLGSEPGLEVPDQVLLPVDPLWPKGLARLRRPPVALFWQGHPSRLASLHAGQAVAVVGSRRPSLHGLRAAESLGEALARAGWPVVSGLAEGIDAAVHRGCLAGGGQPLAVVGTPLDRVYPPEHAPLQAQVAESGLVVTELAPGDRVRRASFVLRNRLLVALSRAVVVVECPMESGALISAREALLQGRSLWAMPADVMRSSAQGSNHLLQKDAQPLVDVASWVQSLGAPPLPSPLRALAEASASTENTVNAQHRLAEADPALMALLEDGASLPRLASQLGRSTSHLAEQLVQLELEGVLRAEPGMRWRLA